MKSLALFRLLAASLLLSATGFAAEPVKLLLARSVAGWDGSGVEGYIEVENLAYEKEVTVVYRVGDGLWREEPAAYAAPTVAGREAWSFSLPPVKLGMKQCSHFELMVRARLAGQTVWDAGDGAGYRVGVGYDPRVPGVVLGQARLLAENVQERRSANLATKSVSGSVLVKNLDPAKRVLVVYTSDGWRTQATAEAQFDRSVAEGVELWSYGIDLPTSAREVDFALMTEMNGEVAWDNNFGRNYQLALE